MKVDVVTTKRTFHLRDLTEAEGLILRTLLNINEEGITKALMADELYWSHEVLDIEAVRIGCEIRDKIMRAVDGNV